MSDQNRVSWVEFVVVAIISMAALATSWASYQASLWNGVQAVRFGRAGAFRTMSVRHSIDASVTRAIEVGLFSSWLDAEHSNNASLANFYEARFPASLRPAFREWLAQQPLTNPRAAPSPFALASYRPAQMVEAEQLEGKAEAEFAGGQSANKISNSFIRVVVMNSTAMFFGGMAQVFLRRSLRITMATVALAACSIGLVTLLLLPMRSLG